MRNNLKGTREVVHYLIPKYASGNTLDVGAGTAKYKSFILAHVKSYLTTDIEAGPHIDYVEDATKLSFADNSFDTVFSFQTLEHVEKPDAMVSEIHRILKPAGTCIVTVPFLMPAHAYPYDFQRYTLQGLEVLFKKHDFTIVECESYGGLFSVLSEMLKFLFIEPGGGKKKNGRIRTKIVGMCMRFLIFLDGLGLSKNENFYPNSYIVVKK
jgi:SAM-dependent methyltransferase